MVREDEIREIVSIVSEILKADKLDEHLEILTSAMVSTQQIDTDNLNWQTHYYYALDLRIDVQVFVKIREKVQSIEAVFLEKIGLATRHFETDHISEVRIVPKVKNRINWQRLIGIVNKEDLINHVNYLKNVMVSVSTGGAAIRDEENRYRKDYLIVDEALKRLNLDHPNPHKTLWEWYGKWKADFPHYQERRMYVTGLYNTVLELLHETTSPESISIEVDLTDWERVERSVELIKKRRMEKSEEELQAIGLLCRETIIHLAQAVYNRERHPSPDGTEISKTDAKRMIEAYLTIELAGQSFENLRKFARAAFDLANELQHKRNATIKDSSLCVTATISLINLIGTLEGRL